MEDSIKMANLIYPGYFANGNCMSFDTRYIAFLDGDKIKNLNGDIIKIGTSGNKNIISNFNEIHQYNSVKTDLIMNKDEPILVSDIVFLIGDKLYNAVGNELNIGIVQEVVEKVIETQVVQKSTPIEVTPVTPTSTTPIIDCTKLDIFGDGNCYSYSPLKNNGKDVSNLYNLTDYYVEFNGFAALYAKPNDLSYLDIKKSVTIKQQFAISFGCRKQNENTINTIISCATDNLDNAFTVGENSSGIFMYIDDKKYESTVRLNPDWNHITINVDNTTVKLFLNEVLIITVNKTYNVDTPVRIILGQDQDSIAGGFQKTQSFLGDYKNFRLFDAALTIDQIKTLTECDYK